jgi:succinylarginine dihydrolase
MWQGHESVPLTEINFDGLIGPSHNYAGLSLGNLASAKNAGGLSQPRAAALQGLEKMRANLRLGLVQGLFVPHDRPNKNWLNNLGADMASAEPHIRAAAFSASAMWAANAATVSPAPDCSGGLCHLTPANLVTMPHRSHEWPGTIQQLRLAFSDSNHFAVHLPILPPFGDEGAANHMRLCTRHDAPGVEVFVYGVAGGPFPARQHVEASKAVARKHGVAQALFVQQSEEAIAAGAFHNDVVAVANENVLFAHELAFADKARFFEDLRTRLPEVQIVEVPASAVSLADAIQSYLFNAQLVTLPEGNGPIRHLIPVDVRQSMANGGGPACLRLRVVCDPATVDPRFLLDEAKIDQLSGVVSSYWPEAIDPNDLSSESLWSSVAEARSQLCAELGLAELSD